MTGGPPGAPVLGDMGKSRYLTPDHPSYGCDQAWFFFAVRDPKGPGFCRMLLVEAKSHAAVAFLERVCAMSEGEVVHRASPTCELMSVHRQCPTIGIRSDLVEEVQFADFALDVVERARVDRDPLALQAIREATVAEHSPAIPPPPSSARASGATAMKRESAIAAITGLGYSKPQALGMLKPLEDRIASMSLEDIIRQSLRSAAA